MEFIKPGRQFDFMGKRRWFIGASAFLLFLSVISFFYPGLKLGTDFKGGTEVEIALKVEVPAADVREAVHRAGFEAPEVVAVTDKASENRMLIRVHEVSILSEAQKAAARDKLCYAAEGVTLPEDRCPPAVRPAEVRFSPGGDKISLRYESTPDLGAVAGRLAGIEGLEVRSGAGAVVLASEQEHKVDVHLKSKGDQLVEGLQRQLGADKVPDQALRVEWIGPRAGAQLRDAAIRSVGIAILFIMAYIAARFDLRFAPGGIVALVHDVGIAMGAMAITGREITISTVAAMLTIVGYSITDTVVVYDRIRENLTRHRGMTFAQVINLSISEMLGRTIITSGVTALSMLAFLWWGTGVLRDFAFALLVGISVGTYSSIYVAAPLTEWIDQRFFASGATRHKPVSRVKAEKKKKAVV